MIKNRFLKVLKKLISIWVVCLFLCPGIVALAEPVPQLTQTISLVESLPSGVSLRHRYTTQDQWMSVTKTYGPAVYVPVSTFDSYFPVGSNNTRVAKVSTFTPSMLAALYEYTETYTLPAFDFSFDHCYSSLIYVCEVDNNGSTSFQIADSNITLTKSDGTSQNYAGILKTYNVNGSFIRFLVQFDCDLVEFSSDITTLGVTLSFENDTSYPQQSSTLTFRTNFFPFVVTSDYEGTELFTAATYTLIQNQVLPSIDNITTVMEQQRVISSRAAAVQESMAAQQSQMAVQQSQAAAAQMSQAAAQHSEEMAALESLPAAQASAVLDQAAAAADSFARAEVAQDQAVAATLGSSIPDVEQFVNAPLAQFVAAFEDSGREAVLEFPAIKVPALIGGNSALTLSESKVINLSYYIDEIESSQFGLFLISAARSFVTLGLIVFVIRVFISTVKFIISKGDLDDHIEKEIEEAERHAEMSAMFEDMKKYSEWDF